MRSNRTRWISASVPLLVDRSLEIKQDGVSFIAAIMATKDYPDTGIGAQMIPNVTISKGVTLWVVQEDELPE